MSQNTNPAPVAIPAQATPIQGDTMSVYVQPTAAQRRTFQEIVSLFDVRSRSGHDLKAVCPAHPGADGPNLAITAKDGRVLVYCNSRGCAAADIAAAVGLTLADFSNVDTSDAGSVTASAKATGPVPQEATSALAGFLYKAQQRLTSGDKLSQAALEYAAERFGATPADVERLGLGASDGEVKATAPVKLGKAWGKAPRLVVPFRDAAGVPGYVQGRALTEVEGKLRWVGPRNLDDAAWSLWGAFRAANPSTYVIICEGPGDAITAACAGFDAVAIRGAAARLDAADVAAITGFAAGRPIVVAGDSDAAGRGFTAALTALFPGAHPLRVPAGDMADWYAQDRDGFAAALGRYMPIIHLCGVAPTFPPTGLTSDMDAAKFALEALRARGGDAAYVRGAGWHLYDHGRWMALGKDHATMVLDAAGELAHVELEAARAEVSPLIEPATKAERDDPIHLKLKFARDRMGRATTAVHMFESHNRATGVMASMKRVTGQLDPEDMDGDKDMIAVRQGLLNLRTRQILPHDPARHVGAFVDLDYDPEATAPRWEALIADASRTSAGDVDDEWIKAMHLTLGLGLTGHTERVIPVWLGGGKNGKSQITSVLTGVLGKRMVESDSMMIFARGSDAAAQETFKNARHARFLIAQEGDRNMALATSAIKMASGEDPVPAREMYVGRFSYKPSWTVIMVSNFPPNVPDNSLGMSDRLRVFPFDYRVPDNRVVRGLSDIIIRDEAAGVLRWLVDGAAELLNNGMTIPWPERIDTASDRVLEASDPLADFTKLLIPSGSTDPDKLVLTWSSVWGVYQDWAFVTGQTAKLSSSTLRKRLQERGVAMESDFRSGLADADGKAVSRGTTVLRGYRTTLDRELWKAADTATHDELLGLQLEREAERPRPGVSFAPTDPQDSRVL